MNYRVPFVDLPTNFKNLEKEIRSLLEDVLWRRADFILREDLQKFENNAASYLGVKHAIGLNSGTDALSLALRTIDVRPGDEVITVAHTFVATVAAIAHQGTIPILIDVNKDQVMNANLIEDAITLKTCAIIPVHLNGHMCDMEKIMSIAQKYNLRVIEDAAQAWGATFDGKKAGTFGLVGCFSLYPMKLLGGIGDGGILVTNDDNIFERVLRLRDHGQNRKTGEILEYGYNSRLDNLNAAILNTKIQHLPRWIERRREIATLYHRGLSEFPFLQLPVSPEESGKYFDVFQNYVVRSRERDKLVEHLKRDGIETLISWRIPLHHQKSLNLNHFHLPETEQISKEVVSLPMNTEITDDQVKFIINSINNFYVKELEKV